MNKVFIILIFSLSLNTWAQEFESIIGTDNYNNPNILVVTNRLADSTTKMINPVFRNIVDSISNLKYYDVKFEDGNFIAEETTLTEFFQNSPTPLNDWLLFVHGDGKTFIRAAARGLDIQNYYKINVIVFAWPSRLPGGSMTEHFKASLRNAEKSTDNLLALIDSLKYLRKKNSEYFKNNYLSSLYHSLGNKILKLASNRIESKFGEDYIFDNQILNAAAVEQKDHKYWVEKINIQKRIFNNSNVFDLNLNGLRLITPMNYMLGERLSKPLSDSVLYFNFSKTMGLKLSPGKSHTYFLGMPEKYPGVKQYYNEIFHGLMPDTTDASYIKKRKDEFGYDVLK